MWFWFFEARDNPSTAPLALWLNGGPGCSSMFGLFVENGPCTFNNVSGPNPVLNSYSWNNVANMLYVDQPIGVGFSYGSDSDDVTSTTTAAPFVWKLLQAFYSRFPEYTNRNFGLFTESYGGHYGPEFAEYLWVLSCH
jgi:carboxypeptidase C (cathepsin A)